MKKTSMTVAGLTALSFALVSCSAPMQPTGQMRSVVQPAAAFNPLFKSRQKVRDFNRPISLRFDTRLLGEDYQGPERKVSFQTMIPQPENLAQDFKLQAIPLPNPVRPVLECVEHKADGTFRAFFGYKNENNQSVTIPVGPDNKFTPGPADRGQTSQFIPGRTPYYPNAAFSVDFSGGNLVWSLNGRTSTASNNPVQKCEPTTPAEQELIFDPENPASLGGLYPSVPGNQNMSVPETQQAAISLNNMPPTSVITGQLMIKVAEPAQANLDIIRQRFQATVLAGPDSEGVYLIQADMKRVDLSKLSTNLAAINQYIADENFVVESGAFANLESARTLAFLAELVADNLVTGAGFNPVMEPDLVPRTFESEHSSKVGGEGNARNFGWLNERSTNIIDAWDYTLGYDIERDRSVKVAVIDSGFSGLWPHMSAGRDLEGQILYQQGYKLTYANNGSPVSEQPYSESLLASETGYERSDQHGTYVTSLIVSHINDRNGIAGVAPGAKVIPFRVSSTNWYEVRRAIELADAAGAQVINISLGGSNVDPFLLNWTEYLTEHPWYVPMQNTIRRVSQNNVVIAASAGNGGWDASRGIFAGRMQSISGREERVFPELISVGAVVDDPDQTNGEDETQIRPLPIPQNLKRASFEAGSYLEFPPRDTGNNPGNGNDVLAQRVADKLIRYRNDLKTRLRGGSNWKQVDVWLPGHAFVLKMPEFNQGDPIAASGLDSQSGTSLATPIFSGLVALLKSVKPEVNNLKFSSANLFNYLNQNGNFHQNTHDDPLLRQLPKREIGTKCSDLLNTNCGEPYPASFLTTNNFYGYSEVQKTTVRVPIASEIIKHPDLHARQSEILQGKITEASGKLYLETNSGTYRLRVSGNDSASFIKQFTAFDNEANLNIPIQISGLINKPVIVNGWRKNNDLHLLQLVFDSSAPQSCVTDEIVTDPGWVWFKGAERKNAVVVNAYLGHIRIPPAANGNPVRPIWSELSGSGQPLCSSCLVDFWYDYALPANYQVTEAKMQIQTDDEAFIYVDRQYAGTANYNETFGAGVFKQISLPTNLFNSSTGIYGPAPVVSHMISLTLRGVNTPSGSPSTNFAGVAAKLTIKACPR